MLNLVSTLACIVIKLNMAYGNSEYVDESQLDEVLNSCTNEVNLWKNILVTMGIIKPYRPGVYKVLKSS